MAGHVDCPVFSIIASKAEQVKKKSRCVSYHNRHFLEICVVKAKAASCMIQVLLREQKICLTCSPKFRKKLKIVYFTKSQWLSKCGPWTRSILLTSEPVRDADCLEPP
ncbi:hypothetical protein H1C71_039928 [Ictidomys tridecemlineatus]|nr:hypothetical protein H1C71_039928 [Ictidomys tridecemlineatus]